MALARKFSWLAIPAIQAGRLDDRLSTVAISMAFFVTDVFAAIGAGTGRVADPLPARICSVRHGCRARLALRLLRVSYSMDPRASLCDSANARSERRTGNWS